MNQNLDFQSENVEETNTVSVLKSIWFIDLSEICTAHLKNRVFRHSVSFVVEK